ncbi:hypothetical protein Bint_2892 [Brachyspira intermedia PWS/A]|uniref:Uncharacterized protein n=1 Tax=Brachyspira intermedia (strain ATCC 51140 / PWS/A) TaxID=1045858 RepID=G0EID1_BRAIP|nr:hypothetical protein Bint_2892 [Brachyspira intermedia PWS/A]
MNFFKKIKNFFDFLRNLTVIYIIKNTYSTFIYGEKYHI